MDTYGYKMTGLKAASGATKTLNRKVTDKGAYIQISYNKKTGEIITNFHVSFGQNSWTKYDDPAIVTIGNVIAPMTMQQLAIWITSVLELAGDECIQ